MWMMSEAPNDLAFDGWQNVELHRIPTSSREQFFVAFLNWWGGPETFRHLIVMKPPVFAYYSEVARGSAGSKEPVVQILVSKLIVMAIIYFCAIERDGVQYISMKD